jgi:hypothetical protein
MKKTKGCVQSMVADADNFVCEFPKEVQANPEHKALLLSTVLFIDFMSFEDNKKRNGP